jgi:hypothetical protein
LAVSPKDGATRADEVANGRRKTGGWMRRRAWFRRGVMAGEGRCNAALRRIAARPVAAMFDRGKRL